jgi:hypothetical protein
VFSLRILGQAISLMKCRDGLGRLQLIINTGLDTIEIILEMNQEFNKGFVYGVIYATILITAGYLIGALIK